MNPDKRVHVQILFMVVQRALIIILITTISGEWIAPESILSCGVGFSRKFNGLQVLDMSIDDSNSGAKRMRLVDAFVRAARPVIEITKLHSLGTTVGVVDGHIEYLKTVKFAAEANSTTKNRHWCNPLTANGRY